VGPGEQLGGLLGALGVGEPAGGELVLGEVGVGRGGRLAAYERDDVVGAGAPIVERAGRPAVLALCAGRGVAGLPAGAVLVEEL
jgi:hypothetical protein